jgi:hypothetical protein
MRLWPKVLPLTHKFHMLWLHNDNRAQLCTPNLSRTPLRRLSPAAFARLDTARHAFNKVTQDVASRTSILSLAASRTRCITSEPPSLQLPLPDQTALCNRPVTQSTADGDVHIDAGQLAPLTRHDRDW